MAKTTKVIPKKSKKKSADDVEIHTPSEAVLSVQEFIGQERWLNFFAEALKTNNLAQAYLLSGQAGLGKSSLAYILAKAFVCSSDRLDACGSCPSCASWVSGQHPDVVILDGRSDGSVEATREFMQKLSPRPFYSSRRVAIILDIDALTWPSLHALLKTLEEPPSSTVVIATATDLGGLPKTAKSRMQICKLAPLAIPQLSKQLVAEGLSPAEASRLASLAQGKPAWAKNWLRVPAARQAYEAEAANMAKLLAEDILQKFNYTESLTRSNEIGRQDVDAILTHWLVILRDGLLLANNRPEQVAHQDLKAGLQSLQREADWWWRAIDNLLIIRRQLASYANRRLVLNSFFINL